ncbi:MAG: PqqD family protein [Pseudomonadota bacterium]
MKFKRPADGVLHTEVDSGLALLDPNTNTYFLLNRTGAIVWMALEQEVTLEELCAKVADRFDVTAEICQPDVMGLLDMMVAKGFVVTGDESTD